MNKGTEEQTTASLEAELRKALEGTETAEKTVSSLSLQLERARDDLREERFLYLLAVVVLLDVHFFTSMETWSGPLAILVLEVIGVIAVASRFRVGEVQKFTDKLLAAVSKRNTN